MWQRQDHLGYARSALRSLGWSSTVFLQGWLRLKESGRLLFLSAECEHLCSPYVSHRRICYRGLEDLPSALADPEKWQAFQPWLYAANAQYRACIRAVRSLAECEQVARAGEDGMSGLLHVEEHEALWHAVLPRCFGEALLARAREILGPGGTWDEVAAWRNPDEILPFLEVWAVHRRRVGWDEESGRPIWAEPPAAEAEAAEAAQESPHPAQE